MTGTQIEINTLGGNDSLTIDLSLGDFAKSIVYDGGSQTTTDSLVVIGDWMIGSVAHTFTSAAGGTIDITGNCGITYTGVEESISDNLIATDRDFTLGGGVPASIGAP